MSFAFMPLYTGDYLRDTVDLSPREHGAYLMMLLWCWSNAKPMPNDMQRICRLARARDEQDEAAVRYVLDRFFTMEADGCWHNSRMEEELKRANNLSERGKAGAAARWGRKPKMNWHADKQMLVACLSDAKPMDPTTTPTLTLIPTTPSGKPDAMAILEFLNAKAGRTFRPVRANLELIEARLKEGATPDECRSVIAKKCREWKGSDMAAYLRPATLFNRTKFAQYQGELRAVS